MGIVLNFMAKNIVELQLRLHILKKTKLPRIFTKKKLILEG